MDLNETFIRHLNNFEILCANGHFDNFSFSCEIFSSFKNLPKAFESTLISVLNHDYDQILRLKISDLGLKLIENSNKLPSVCFEQDVVSDSTLLYARQLLLLFVGVSALQVFIRENFTGPSSDENVNLGICSDVIRDLSCDELLSVDAEFVTDNVTHKEAFVLSKIFLLASKEMDGGSLTCNWWNMRHVFVHQQLLPDRLHGLKEELYKDSIKIYESNWLNEDSNRISKLLFYVELSQYEIYYQKVSEAKKHTESARDLVGLDIDFSGAYGKRTRFQQKSVAQLTVKLARSGLVDGNLPVDDCNVPKDLLLGDDTLLNKVSFTDSDANHVEALTPEEQIVLFVHCQLLKRSEASDALLQEQLASYVSCLLDQPKVWSIYITVLVLRCKLEKESSRRVERSLMQLESIIDSFREREPPFAKRAFMMYAVAFPMRWTLEKELADIQLSMGATKSALALYEKLNMWQEVVVCLQMLGRTSQAEVIVRRQLQEQETPMLWCLLGDILGDPSMYHKADLLSNGKNPRGQRSLGYHYYKKKEWEKSIEHFVKSLETNHLQCGVWYSLGYAALQTEDYGLAAKAYRQVVVLDPDNFEAWNNLSNAYIRTKQKERAWHALQEALKCNYEEWRVWENFLLVSIDIGAFEEVIKAWHRLMDIKQKYFDSQVLRILVRAINENLPDMGGQPTSRLHKPALELLGRISSAIPNEFCIWECYSLLLCPDAASSSDIEVLEKALVHQQKAMRHYSVSQSPGVASLGTAVEVARRALELTLKLVVLLQERDARIARYKSSTRLSVQSMMKKVKSCLEDLSIESYCSLKEPMDHVDNLIGGLQ